MNPSDTVERFLATGAYDPLFAGWEGSATERRRQGTLALRGILARIVTWRARHAPRPADKLPSDAEDQVRARVAPMLTGLFPGDEAEVLSHQLPRRVHVVGPTNYAAVIADVPLRTAWDLANLVLDDLGAPPLADDIPELDGLCLDGHAWVLPRAFAPAGPFSDVIVHEVGHLLHTTRREALGLAPAKALLLPVPPRRRETFAYACEVWSCILTGSFGNAPDGVAAFRATATPEDARVDRARLDRLLDDAAADPARGWAGIREWAGRG